MTFNSSNLHISSLFLLDNCVKNSGTVEEGVNFDDNSHNSLEPGGWWEYTVQFMMFVSV